MSISNLTLRLQGRTILQDIHLEIAPGEKVGLIGPNGAGKTSLIMCLAGLENQYQGDIRVDTLNPKQAKDRKQLPKVLGVLFQESDDQIIHATVEEDIAFGPLNLGLSPEETRKRVTEACQLLSLQGYEKRIPFELSGGEKRRVALAGLLAMQPKIFILDEPTIYLDGRGRRDFIQTVQQLPQAKLIASHDLRFIQETCSRVIVLHEGKLLASGNTSDILNQSAWMEELGID